jgi:hypothetical protein
VNHQEALRGAAVEKYLLNEMPEPERDEFEEHFFDCAECAADLKTTAAFLDGAKKELRLRAAAESDAATGPASQAPPTRLPKAPKKPWFDFFWRPTFAAPAFALLLGVMVYQNVVVFPRSGEGAPREASPGEGSRGGLPIGAVSSVASGADGPEILASLSLIGGNSRGGGIPAATLAKGASLLISLDIPTADRFSGYTCALVDASGAVLWRVPVSAEQAKDTVAIRVPSTQLTRGEYRLVVRGNANNGEEGEPPLANYRFTLN